jgi:hypothetical protein
VRKVEPERVHSSTLGERLDKGLMVAVGSVHGTWRVADRSS